MLLMRTPLSKYPMCNLHKFPSPRQSHSQFAKKAVCVRFDAGLETCGARLCTTLGTRGEILVNLIKYLPKIYASDVSKNIYQKSMHQRNLDSQKHSKFHPSALQKRAPGVEQRTRFNLPVFRREQAHLPQRVTQRRASRRLL